jgi:enamine deaminase RidA (YjgF/YER057c/UK114 family)
MRFEFEALSYSSRQSTAVRRRVYLDPQNITSVEHQMDEIKRVGTTRRWSDAVIFQGVAHFVEVADDPSLDLDGQVAQILAQAELRLTQIGSDLTQLLQVLIYLADLTEAGIMNERWDAWIPAGHAPSRACVQAGLAPGYRVEMVFTAAICDRTNAAPV